MSTDFNQDIKKNTFRFYEAEYPKVDDVVMVEVTLIKDQGINVSLLEYNNIEGMILKSEISRRRIRSLAKLVKVGRHESATVLRIEDGFIDLSRRRVSSEDAAQCNERYQRSKIVHSILSHLAIVTHRNLDMLYHTITWPLMKKFGHAYEAFKVIIQNSKEVFENLKEKLENVVYVALQTRAKHIFKEMESSKIKVRADLEITCFQYDGVSAIQEAIRAAQTVSSELLQIEIKMSESSPDYVMIVRERGEHYTNKNTCLELIERATQACKRVLTRYSGFMKVKNITYNTSSDLGNLHQHSKEVVSEDESESGSEESKSTE